MVTIGFPCREYTTFERIIRISLTFNYNLIIVKIFRRFKEETLSPVFCFADKSTDKKGFLKKNQVIK